MSNTIIITANPGRYGGCLAERLGSIDELNRVGFSREHSLLTLLLQANFPFSLSETAQR